MSGARLLFVCTANRCRSPMAEAITRELIDGRALDLTTSSCGLMAGGEPMTDGAIEVLAERNIDGSGHISRQIDAAMIGDANLIATMERRHLLAIVELVPDAGSKAFTLRELTRAPDREPDEGVKSWVERTNARRTPGTLIGMSRDDDVGDPIGRSRRRYRRCLQELDELCSELINRIAPVGSS